MPKRPRYDCVHDYTAPGELPATIEAIQRVDAERREQAFRELRLCGMYLRLAFLELRGDPEKR